MFELHKHTFFTLKPVVFVFSKLILTTNSIKEGK